MKYSYFVNERDNNGFLHGIFVSETIEDVFDFIREYEETTHMKNRYVVRVYKNNINIGDFRI